ncbi:MAG: Hsp20/alpha crystallin family protein [Anaerolineae bacterium]|nr:Hsp20/alpha crystallin family protein [Anaerolineae bacterium]
MATQNEELQVQEKQEIVESGPERTRARIAFNPRTDIYETGESIVLLADMPGVSENSVEITLEKNILTISGYVEDEQPEGYARAYAEYRVGDFQRSFTLSSNINQDGIEATVSDGVLTLTMPKVVPTTKKILVKAG